MSTKRLERATQRLIKRLDAAYDAFEEFNSACEDQMGDELEGDDERVRLARSIGEYSGYLERARWWRTS